MRSFPILVMAAGIAATLAPKHALACGGCFIPLSQSTVVTDHRMAVSIATERSILWDQIRYTGSPEEFAWVLPVKGDVAIETAQDAFFETLDATTSVVVRAPQLYCSYPDGYYDEGGGGGGCGARQYETESSSSGSSSGGASAERREDVSILSSSTVGPYETVTVRSNVPDALPAWLAEHGFNVDDTVAPVINAYTSEGFDFVALRLRPGASVNEMQPVRIIFPGALMSFPLRMVAAGTGDKVGLTLFVIAEGRWMVSNSAEASVSVDDLSWNFGASSSNYTALREAALGANNGNAWLAPYARERGLTEPLQLPNTFQPIRYTSGGSASTTITGAYFLQGAARADISASQRDTCVQESESLGGVTGVVTELCDGQSCRAPAQGEVDSRRLTCAGLDDISRAMLGMRLEDVWLTRLEANLPKRALQQDLQLGAAQSQTEVSNFITAKKATNIPSNCSLQQTVAAISPSTPIFNMLATMLPVMFGIHVMRRRQRQS